MDSINNELNKSLISSISSESLSQPLSSSSSSSSLDIISKDFTLSPKISFQKCIIPESFNTTILEEDNTSTLSSTYSYIKNLSSEEINKNNNSENGRPVDKIISSLQSIYSPLLKNEIPENSNTNFQKVPFQNMDENLKDNDNENIKYNEISEMESKNRNEKDNHIIEKNINENNYRSNDKKYENQENIDKNINIIITDYRNFKDIHNININGKKSEETQKCNFIKNFIDCTLDEYGSCNSFEKKIIEKMLSKQIPLLKNYEKIIINIESFIENIINDLNKNNAKEQNLITNIEQLKNELKKSKDTIKQLNQYSINVTEENKGLKMYSIKIENENNNLKEHIKTVEKEICYLKEHVNTIEKENSNLKQYSQKMEKDNIDLEHGIDKYKKYIKQLCKNEQKEVEKRQKEEELKKILMKEKEKIREEERKQMMKEIENVKINERKKRMNEIERISNKKDEYLKSELEKLKQEGNLKLKNEIKRIQEEAGEKLRKESIKIKEEEREKIKLEIEKMREEEWEKYRVELKKIKDEAENRNRINPGTEKNDNSNDNNDNDKLKQENIDTSSSSPGEASTTIKIKIKKASSKTVLPDSKKASFYDINFIETRNNIESIENAIIRINNSTTDIIKKAILIYDYLFKENLKYENNNKLGQAEEDNEIKRLRHIYKSIVKKFQISLEDEIKRISTIRETYTEKVNEQQYQLLKMQQKEHELLSICHSEQYKENQQQVQQIIQQLKQEFISIQNSSPKKWTEIEFFTNLEDTLKKYFRKKNYGSEEMVISYELKLPEKNYYIIKKDNKDDLQSCILFLNSVNESDTIQNINTVFPSLKQFYQEVKSLSNILKIKEDLFKNDKLDDQQTIDNNIQSINKLKEELMHTKNTLEETEQKCNELINEKERIMEELKNTTSHIKVLENDVNKKKEDLREFLSEHNTLVNLYNTVVDEEKRKYSTLEEDYNQLQNHQIEYEKKLKILENENCSLLYELDNYKKRSNQMKNYNSQFYDF